MAESTTVALRTTVAANRSTIYSEPIDILGMVTKSEIVGAKAASHSPENAAITGCSSPESLRNRFEHALTTLTFPKSPTALYGPIRYILNGGGKRIRPILMLMSGELFQGDIETLLPAALAVEIFHAATLVHDDFMDAASLRRGRTTVHKKWGPSIAILAGDALTGTSYTLLNQTPPASLPAALNVFNTATSSIYEGQSLDLDFEARSVEAVTLEDYLEMISLKTAALFAGALQIGALLSKAPDADQERLHQFGKALGIAFQLQDDLLDVFGSTTDFGKTIGGDILANKKTFLLLKAYDLAKPDMRAAMDRLLQLPSSEANEKIQGMKEVFVHLNVKAAAEHERDRLIEEALDQLDAVAVSKERKTALKNLALQLGRRHA